MRISPIFAFFFILSLYAQNDISIGMTTEELQRSNPKIWFKPAPNIYGTCADEETGFEIWDQNELLGFSAGNPDRGKINNLVIVSPRIGYGDIRVGSKLSKILKSHPKLSASLDLLSGWEYVYVKEHNIKLVFKTDENDRIGIYKGEDFVKWKNKKRKVDFIEVF